MGKAQTTSRQDARSAGAVRALWRDAREVRHGSACKYRAAVRSSERAAGAAHDRLADAQRDEARLTRYAG
jgi:hypothetical protein